MGDRARAPINATGTPTPDEAISPRRSPDLSTG